LKRKRKGGDIVMKVKPLILLTVGLSIFASTPSWGRLTHVQAGEAKACSDLVSAKHLKGTAWRAEYDKCMSEGHSDYK
jgi:hypothetical protein